MTGFLFAVIFAACLVVVGLDLYNQRGGWGK